MILLEKGKLIYIVGENGKTNYRESNVRIWHYARQYSSSQGERERLYMYMSMYMYISILCLENRKISTKLCLI